MRPWTVLPLLLLAALSPLSAQGRRRGGPDPQEVMQHILKVRMDRLQATLGLPEERARTIATAWNRRDTCLMEHGRKLSDLRRQAQDILQGGGSDSEKDPRIKPILERMQALRQHQADLRQRFEEEVRQGLSPSQQARFIFLAEDLDRHIREGMREAMRGGRREST